MNTAATASSIPIAARAIGTLNHSSSPRFTAPTVTDWATVGPTPASFRRMALMPMAALASSPVERSVKNDVGSRSSLSHTAGWSAASTRPSSRSRVRFCSSMKAAATTLLRITARHTCTISPVCAFGTNSPSTFPVARGTRAPSATVTSPLSSSPVRSPRVPAMQNRISRSGPSRRSGNGR
ncbi:hypothetical protein SHIRM173S_11869 [Streptomyces hirsutus]